MQPHEDYEYAFCADCRTEMMISDRIFPIERDRALCFDCATQRSGVYQDLLGRWTVPPLLDDLP